MIRLSFIGLLLMGRSAFDQTDSIKPQIPTNFKDTTTTVISIRDTVNADIKKAPLYVISGKRFNETPINQLFLDINNIKTINVITPGKNSIRSFGPKAKNGVIVISTKHPVEWLTTKQIIKQYAKGSSRKHTLFIVDNARFDGMKNLYFEKSNLTSVEVQDSTTTLNNTKYLKMIKIKTKGNGTS